MKDKKKKAKFYILLVAVFIIWAAIIINVIGRLDSNDYEIIDDNLDVALKIYKEIKDNNEAKSTPEFFSLSRDPFVLRKVKPPRKVNPKKVVEKPKTQPQLKFNVQGIISNQDNKLVIIEDLTNRTTVFLAKGDKHETITILDVKENLVKLKVGKEIKEFRIN